MFLLMLVLHALCLLSPTQANRVVDTCVFQNAGFERREIAALTATSASDNNTVCPPGEIKITIPLESQDDIVISWAAAPCEVSGYFVYLRELDAISPDLTSSLCTETHVNLKRDLAKFFSKFAVRVYSVKNFEHGGVIKSTPSTFAFAVCPSRKPEGPADVEAEVFANSRIRFSWRWTDTLWEVKYFTFLYCEENGPCPDKSVNVSSAEMSLELSTLLDKKYYIELYGVSDTEECGEVLSRSYRSWLDGRNVISNFDVNCTRDLKNFYTKLTWRTEPDRFEFMQQRKSFSYTYSMSGKDVKINSTNSFNLNDVCSPQGDCLILLENLLRVDDYYQFRISARSLDSVVYYSNLTDEANCNLKTRAPTHTNAAIVDVTQNYSAMIETPETQRVIVIDKNIFSLTDGMIITSMVVIGDPAEMRKPLDEIIPFQKTFDHHERLLPTRITPEDWNIYSEWTHAESQIDDPALRCQWMCGIPSDYVVCGLGVEKCDDSPFKSCNGPLAANKEFGLRIRACTSAGCGDTEIFQFSTGDGDPVVEPTDDSSAFSVLIMLIVCIVVGGMTVVVAAVLILRWHEMREMHREQCFQLIEF